MHRPPPSSHLPSPLLSLNVIWQSNYKKNAKRAEEALSSGMPPPRPVYLPFPAWLETKNRITAQLEDTRKAFGDRSREWEEKEQVRLRHAEVICRLSSSLSSECIVLSHSENATGSDRVHFFVLLYSTQLHSALIHSTLIHFTILSLFCD